MRDFDALPEAVQRSIRQRAIEIADEAPDLTSKQIVLLRHVFSDCGRRAA